MGAGKGSVPWSEVQLCYELLTGALYDVLDREFGVSSRALSRQQLRDELTGEKRLPVPTWERIEKVLDYLEMVRFASGAGVVTEAAARQEFLKWVNEAQLIDESFRAPGAQH
jgi:hypothetical protein